MPTLHFKGKPFLRNYHHAVQFHTLVAQKALGLSKEPSLDDNLVIHGDNLKALKALLPTHAGKVKCIYIDPPYNTGNESWAYNDNVASPMIQKWLGEVVAKDDLNRHDKWCCMIYPRLTLLRELLNEDGVIFVSIDDNEIQHLRMIMDEVFGEENFITTIIWQKIYSPRSSAKFFSENHDYIVVYAKNHQEWDRNLLPRTEEQDARYSNPDNDPRGPWKPSDLSARNYYSKGTFSITCPSGRVIPSPPGGRYWRCSEENFKKLIADNRIWWGPDGSNVPAIKRFLSEVKQGIVPHTIWTYKEVGHTQDAKKSILEIFDGEMVFMTPKPVDLIKRIIELSTNENDLILDSFAGSGTTGQAVLELNKQDGGNRKFILIECEHYANQITAERIRRVIQGIPNTKDENLKEGLGGTFSYYELGDPIEMDHILEGKNLPAYDELAKFVFFTATGEKFDASKLNQATYHIGSSKTLEVYLLYETDVERLKKLSLNLDFAEKIYKKHPNRQKLVFAPCCFIEDHHLREYGIRFAQLPFEIYRVAQ